MKSLQLVKTPSGATCLVNGSEWIGKSQLGVVFLNAGIVNMAGPNRLYVKFAERLKHEGLPSFRFDFSGVGSNTTTNDEFEFDDYQINETTFILEEIKHQYGIKAFILIGLCSGGDVAYRLVNNENHLIKATVLINAYLMPRDKIKEIHEVAKQQLESRLYRKHLLDMDKWIGVLRKNPRRLFTVLKKFVNQTMTITQPSPTSLTSSTLQLETKDTPLLLIYSEGSVSYEVFKMKFANNHKKLVEHGVNNPEMVYFAHTDHNFATVISQLKLFDAVVKWLNESNFLAQPPREKPAIENLYH